MKNLNGRINNGASAVEEAELNLQAFGDQWDVKYAKGSFPNDELIIRLIYMAMQTIATKWTMPIQNRDAVINQFSIEFEEWLPV